MWGFSTFSWVPSSPRFSTLPTMPTALMTRSTVISWLLPPDVMVAVTLSLAFLRLLTRGGGGGCFSLLFFCSPARGGGQDLHALLLERPLGEGRDLLVLHRQDTVQDFGDRHLGTHGAVEARE